MFGPLPKLYRLLVVAAAVVVCIAAGVWVARHFDLPLRGVGVGAAAGLLVAYALVHDFRHEPRTLRVPRRHD